MGSSGSIGKSTLDVIRCFPELFSVAGVAVNSNTQLLLEQVAEFSPRAVAVRNPKQAEEIAAHLPEGTALYIGDTGLNAIAADLEYDIFLGAMVGFAGLAPTLEAIKRGKRIALANKETLVVAGELVTALCKQYQADLLPVDSEHSAIFQCLCGEKHEQVRQLVLTASGGPFYNVPKEQFSSITLQQALAHPTWKMGSKITIDSATMMNKGLEVIEAHWLFGFPKDQISVVIHPQSIIHSFVEFVDGSIKAQLSTPDMKLPIQYALTYPDRLPASHVQTHFPTIGSLTFHEPDTSKFECLDIAFSALNTGGTAPCILNAANEIAVDRFLRGEISFTKIPYIINKALDLIPFCSSPDIEQIFNCDREARLAASQL